MATQQPDKKPRRKKMPETVRERAQKESAKKQNKKPSKVKAVVYKPLTSLRKLGAKEYHPVKVSDKTKTGKVMGKKVHFIPGFLKSSWAELKQVTWPTKKEAFHKTLAVLGFAAVIMIIVQILDFVFSKLVKEIILK